MWKSRPQEALVVSGMNLSGHENQTSPASLFHYIFEPASTHCKRQGAIHRLSAILNGQEPHHTPIFQGWLTLLLAEILDSDKESSDAQTKIAFAAVKELAASVVDTAAATSHHTLDTSPLLGGMIRLEPFAAAWNKRRKKTIPKFCWVPFATALMNQKEKNLPKFDSSSSAIITARGIKALSKICGNNSSHQSRIADLGVTYLLKHLLLCDDYDAKILKARQCVSNGTEKSSASANNDSSSASKIRRFDAPITAHIRRHAAQLFSILSLVEKVRKEVVSDEALCQWLEDCANGNIPCCNDPKLRSYARATLWNSSCIHHSVSDSRNIDKNCPRYVDGIFLINPERNHWKFPLEREQDTSQMGESSAAYTDIYGKAVIGGFHSGPADPQLDVVFVHGLLGGPYKSWRVEDKFSTDITRVGNIDPKTEKHRTFWPCAWLQYDIPEARVFSVKYQTNLSAWFAASIPLEDISSMVLEKLRIAGIGDRPVVFITHSMGDLVVKQLLYEANAKKIDNLINNTVGLVFYGCPHFGSKLANMTWAMHTILRPSPIIGELRRGSPRLKKLNNFICQLWQERKVEMLNFCERKKTLVVGRHRGWPIGIKIVPRKSSNLGFGRVVDLESSDHISMCKPSSPDHPAYKKTLELLQKVKPCYG